MNYKYIFLFAIFGLLFSSCSDEESSDLSCLTAEMCDVYLSAPQTANMALTDSDRKISFEKPLTITWASKADSTYRAMLYYNAPITSSVVSPLYAERVLILVPQAKEKAEEWRDNADPVILNSLWLAKNGKYLNMSVSVKSGATSDDTQYHSVGMVCDTVCRHAMNAKHCYRMCHSQNDVPSHYTIKTYFSIPIVDVPRGDTISVTVPTYEGQKVIEVVKE